MDRIEKNITLHSSLHPKLSALQKRLEFDIEETLLVVRIRILWHTCGKKSISSNKKLCIRYTKKEIQYIPVTRKKCI
jgi:hypothetical protein